jgi:hypothetical protein
MKKWVITCVAVGLIFVLLGCQQSEIVPAVTVSGPAVSLTEKPDPGMSAYPKIASWLAKKDEIIASQKPYNLIMSGWFTPEEASQIRSLNPEAILLAGLTINWVWDNPDWMTFLTTIASYGKKVPLAITEEVPLAITEDMYLHEPGGERCAFGWASASWGQEEIYAMDPRNPEWIELIISFYKNVLDQPQHDGIIIDMLLEKSLFPDAISDQEWVDTTRNIMAGIKALNTTGKMVIFNSGRDYSEIDDYKEFMDGYLMENFLGEQLKSTFEDGLKAADTGYLVIYAVDTDDTGQQDLSRMRLGLTLSLLNDNTYFTYDFGPRDHGQAWWFDEYDVDLGKPLGNYYQKGGAYYREFEKGTVIASPASDTTVTFNRNYIDIISNEEASEFQIPKGDGRIYVKAD